MKGYLSEAATFIKIFYKTTALGPVLIADVLLFILCGLSFATSLLFAQITLLVLFVLSIGTTLYQVVFFTHRDPDRLAWQHQIMQRNLIERIFGDESHDMSRAKLAAAILNPALPTSDSDMIELPEGTEKQPPLEKLPKLA